MSPAKIGLFVLLLLVFVECCLCQLSCYAVVAASTILEGPFCPKIDSYMRICSTSSASATSYVNSAFQNRAAMSLADCMLYLEQQCYSVGATRTQATPESCCSLTSALSECFFDSDCVQTSTKECCSSCENRVMSWKCAGDNSSMMTRACNTNVMQGTVVCEKDDTCNKNWGSGLSAGAIASIVVAAAGIVVAVMGGYRWIIYLKTEGAMETANQQERPPYFKNDLHFILCPVLFIWLVNQCILLSLSIEQSQYCGVFHSALQHGPFAVGSPITACGCNWGSRHACQVVTAWTVFSLITGAVVFPLCLYIRVWKKADPALFSIRGRNVHMSRVVIVYCIIQSIVWAMIFSGVLGGLFRSDNKEVYYGKCVKGSKGTCQGSYLIVALAIFHSLTYLIITGLETMLFYEQHDIVVFPFHQISEFLMVSFDLQLPILRTGPCVMHRTALSWNGFPSPMPQMIPPQGFILANSAYPLLWRASPTGPNVKAIATAILAQMFGIVSLAFIIDSVGLCESDAESGSNPSSILLGTTACVCTISNVSNSFHACKYAETVGWISIVTTSLVVFFGVQRFFSGIWSILDVSMRKMTVIAEMMLSLMWFSVFGISIAGFEANNFIKYGCSVHDSHCNKIRAAVGLAFITAVAFGTASIQEYALLKRWSLEPPHDINVDDVVKNHVLFKLARWLNLSKLSKKDPLHRSSIVRPVVASTMMQTSDKRRISNADVVIDGEEGISGRSDDGGSRSNRQSEVGNEAFHAFSEVDSTPNRNRMKAVKNNSNEKKKNRNDVNITDTSSSSSSSNDSDDSDDGNNDVEIQQDNKSNSSPLPNLNLIVQEGEEEGEEGGASTHNSINKSPNPTSKTSTPGTNSSRDRAFKSRPVLKARPRALETVPIELEQQHQQGSTLSVDNGNISPNDMVSSLTPQSQTDGLSPSSLAAAGVGASDPNLLPPRKRVVLPSITNSTKYKSPSRLPALPQMISPTTALTFFTSPLSQPSPPFLQVNEDKKDTAFEFSTEAGAAATIIAAALPMPEAFKYRDSTSSHVANH